MTLLCRNLAPKIFVFICSCIETFDSLVFKFSLEKIKSVKIRMEIIYDLQFEWNNYQSFQIVQSQQCSGQEHEAYMYTCPCGFYCYAHQATCLAWLLSVWNSESASDLSSTFFGHISLVAGISGTMIKFVTMVLVFVLG